MTTRLATYRLTTADTTDAGWAATEVATLIRQVGPQTIAGMILRQAQRELESLATPEQATSPARVVGPIRIPRAA